MRYQNFSIFKDKRGFKYGMIWELVNWEKNESYKSYYIYIIINLYFFGSLRTSQNCIILYI